MPLDPTIAALLNVLANSGRPPMSQGSAADARAGLRALLVDYRDPATLPQVRSIDTVTVGDGIAARVYRPDSDAQAVPTIVYFHGGGFVIGDLDTHEGVCRLLARDVDAVVVSVDYRLAPEHPFPAAVDDAFAALRHVAEHIDDFGGDRDRLVVGGDSAGGNLAAVCAQSAHADGMALAAQLLVYPAVDMLGDYPSRTENADGYFLTTDDMTWFGRQYLERHELGTADANDPRVSPILTTTLDGLAPAVVVTAEFDPLRDEGNAYAAALDKAGVRVEHRQFAGLIHGFYGMELISPAAAEAMRWTNAALRDIVSG